jgi:hypothetical protein
MGEATTRPSLRISGKKEEKKAKKCLFPLKKTPPGTLDLSIGGSLLN